MTMLSNEEKISIVDQHLRNAEYNKYNLEISLIEENASVNKNVDAISSLNDQINAVTLKITALNAEKAKLTE
jgi:hypothetical protein